MKQLFSHKSESKRQDKRRERRLRLTKIRGSDIEERHNNTVQNLNGSSTLYFDHKRFDLVLIDKCKFEDHLSIVPYELTTAR